MPSFKPTALLFDMDGVIVDSMPVHSESWHAYLRRFGMEAPDAVARMFARRNDEIVREFFGDHLSTAENAAHGEAKEALFREMMAPRLEGLLVPGIRAFLDRHRESKMALVSNADTANIEFVLDGSGLRPYFQAVVDGHQVKHPKPAPDMYLKAAELLGAPPEDCVVFEDSVAGVRAGLAAGMRVVGVETHQPLDGVDHRVRDFTDPELDRWLTSRPPG